MKQGTRVLHLFLRFNISRTQCSFVVPNVSEEVFPRGHTQNKTGEHEEQMCSSRVLGVRNKNKFLICPAPRERVMREHRVLDVCSACQQCKEQTVGGTFLVCVPCVFHSVIRGATCSQDVFFDCQNAKNTVMNNLFLVYVPPFMNTKNNVCMHYVLNVCSEYVLCKEQLFQMF